MQLKYSITDCALYKNRNVFLQHQRLGSPRSRTWYLVMTFLLHPYIPEVGRVRDRWALFSKPVHKGT